MRMIEFDPITTTKLRTVRSLTGVPAQDFIDAAVKRALNDAARDNELLAAVFRVLDRS